MRLHHSIIAALLLVPSVASAETPKEESAPSDSKKFYTGVLLGPVVSTTPTAGNTNFTFGGRFGATVAKSNLAELALGLNVNALNSRSTSGAATSDAWLLMFMGEIISRRAFGTGLYFGGRGGLAYITTSISAGALRLSASGATYTVGPVVGYELEILSMLSLVADVSWMAVGGYTLTFPTASVLTGSRTSFLIQGGVNFHF